MKSFYINIKIFFFLFWSINSIAQLEWNSNKNKIKIPFELTHNLIIVDVVVNEVDLKMILDTGSENNLLFSFPENDSIDFYNPKIIKVRGLGYGETLEAIVSTKNKFSIKNESIVDKNFDILLITDQNIGLINKLGIPINGILGSSFFKNYLVEIDYVKHKLILYQEKNRKLNRRKQKCDSISIKLMQQKPYVDFEITNNNINTEVNLLFDTGLGDGLWLFEDSQNQIIPSDTFFIDILGKGLGGDIFGKKSRVQDLQINKFKLSDALVSFPDSISVKSLDLIKGRNGSLGGEIIKRFNWFLDYENQVFYFKKNRFFKDPFNYNMSGIEVQHSGVELVKESARRTEKSVYNEVDAMQYIYDNSDLKSIHKYSFKPVYIIYAIRENSPADRAGVKINDKIIKINGKKSYNYSIQKITDLFQSEEGKKIKLEVERNGEQLEFEFYLEKIL